MGLVLRVMIENIVAIPTALVDVTDEGNAESKPRPATPVASHPYDSFLLSCNRRRVIHPGSTSRSNLIWVLAVFRGECLAPAEERGNAFKTRLNNIVKRVVEAGPDLPL